MTDTPAHAAAVQIARDALLSPMQARAVVAALARAGRLCEPGTTAEVERLRRELARVREQWAATGQELAESESSASAEIGALIAERNGLRARLAALEKVADAARTIAGVGALSTTMREQLLRDLAALDALPAAAAPDPRSTARALLDVLAAERLDARDPVVAALVELRIALDAPATRDGQS